MPIYRISTYEEVTRTYLVVAADKEEARELFTHDPSSYTHDTEERDTARVFEVGYYDEEK